jgi:hypothetical protein
MQKCAWVQRFKDSTDMFSARQEDFDSPPQASHKCTLFSGAFWRLEPHSLAILAITSGAHKCATGATLCFQVVHHWQTCAVQGTPAAHCMHAPSSGPAMQYTYPYAPALVFPTPAKKRLANPMQYETQYAERTRTRPLQFHHACMDFGGPQRDYLQAYSSSTRVSEGAEACAIAAP